MIKIFRSRQYILGLIFDFDLAKYSCLDFKYFVTLGMVESNKFVILWLYIPLISPVQGPYGKLWTEFFPSFYGPSAKRACHENKEGKSKDP